MEAVTAFQDATDRVDEAAARRLGLNRTDLRCLGLLGTDGAMSSGALATAAGLSPAATTTAIDRLVKAGLVRRHHDEIDRRRVLVEPTAEALRQVAEVWQPVGVESQRRLSKRSAEELGVIHEFLNEGCEMQLRHAQRIAEGG